MTSHQTSTPVVPQVGFDGTSLTTATADIRQPIWVLEDTSGRRGVIVGSVDIPLAGNFRHIATLPAIYPEWLGERSFLETHGLRFPYVAGAMANGIHTAELTVAMARGGMLGFFGAAGLPVERIAQALETIQGTLGSTRLPWGANLIHSPMEGGQEDAVVDLYLRAGVRRVSASAFMALTPSVVRYAATGLRRAPNGDIIRAHHVFAKLSRPEVAARFMSPPPAEILDGLVRDGRLSRAEADLASRLPVAEDITAEADSGGHTDNRPLTALLPTIMALRDRLTREHGYRRPIRVGAAGGLGTPTAVAGAFALGAAYVLTGSINQSSVESGLSDAGKALLAQAGLADVIMAPSADMFELGVKVQVLQRGTMFANRAARLYALYTRVGSLEALSDEERAGLERDVFRMPIARVWELTRRFWQTRDPEQVERAERDPRHQMALVFRWYLGLSSRWAIQGDPDRGLDYQIWCGPAMGAFNDWTAGTFLAEPKKREAVQMALNLLEGAATVTRAQQLRSCGVPVPEAAFVFRPRPLHATVEDGLEETHG